MAHPVYHAADVYREAQERVEQSLGPGRDEEVAAAYWQVLADYPDWAEFLPPDVERNYWLAIGEDAEVV